MTYQEAVSYIHARKRFNGPPTLDRMRRLMALLGDPQERLRIVHIAGTNGKGSTAVMTAAILSAAGLRTGLTVSPFITDFCERIQIDGAPIAHEALAREMTRIAPLAEQVGGMTESELITAAAYSYFADSGCSAVVAEVGLGGRFDATNVISRPLVSVITRIGLDHTDVLGSTLGEIAFEKCGIIKPGVPVVTCGKQDPDALAVIMEECAKRGCTLISGNPGAVREVRSGLDGTDFIYQGMRLHLPLIGNHQITNAVTAITAAGQALPALLGRLPDERTIAKALAGVHVPARFEIVQRNPLVIIDGAHNPQAAGALADALTLLGDQPVACWLIKTAPACSGRSRRVWRACCALHRKARARSVRMSWLCALTRWGCALRRHTVLTRRWSLRRQSRRHRAAQLLSAGRCCSPPRYAPGLRMLDEICLHVMLRHPFYPKSSILWIGLF